jgi:hypothetical protein
MTEPTRIRCIRMLHMSFCLYFASLINIEIKLPNLSALGAKSSYR